MGVSSEPCEVRRAFRAAHTHRTVDATDAKLLAQFVPLVPPLRTPK